MTAMVFRRIWLLLILFGFTTCVEPVEVELPTAPQNLVVDGRITNEPGPYTVRLTYTSAYSEGSAGVNLIVQNATVIIADDVGTSEQLSERAPGVYVTAAAGMRGQVGRSYSVSIQTPDGRQYQSRPDLLKPVSGIDTIYTVFNDGTNGQKRGFNVYLDTKDPQTPGDFYRWNWTHYRFRQYCNAEEDFNLCCNYCWEITRCPGCVIIGTDNLINGNNISGQFLAVVPYTSIDKYFLYVEQTSLTKEAYRFWKTLGQQSQGVGSTFDPPPTPVPGNIYCVSDPDALALGFFGASGIVTKSVAIARTGIRDTPDGVKFPPPPKPVVGYPPPCVSCPVSPSTTDILPKGWIW